MHHICKATSPSRRMSSWSRILCRGSSQAQLVATNFLGPRGKRQDKRSLQPPEFRQKQSQEVLWLNNFCKPALLDAQPYMMDVGMSGPSSKSLPDGRCPRRSAGDGRDVTAETVSKLCHGGHLSKSVDALEVLVQTDCSISKSLFYTVLKKCVVNKDLVLGSRVHACTVKKGYHSDTFLCNHILRMYASHRRLHEAMDVFEGVAQPDAFMWSSIISAHVKQGQDKQAIQLYHRMRRSSVKPDSYVFVAALQACARGGDLKAGQKVHADVLASGDVMAGGTEPDLFVCSCLVDMYSKCGSLEDAQRVFDGLNKKDVVTWNAMIAGYSHNGFGQVALCLYRAMQKDGMVVPDSVTFVCLLQACAGVGLLALENGKDLHAQIRERGHQADVLIANSLVNMYAKCGSLEDAQRVFDGLPHKDVVTWTAMIAGYSQQGMGDEALRVYSAMEEEDMAVPNSVTFVCLLQACTSVGALALEKGKHLHAQIRKQGFQADVFVANSLVSMYAKCGSLEDAWRVFEALGHKDVITWNAMIAGYSQQGMGQEALSLYNEMQAEGMAVPDSVTIVCLLQACAAVGTPALEQGKQLHMRINQQGLQADVFVASSLLNMYAKCGSLQDAERVFEGLGHKDVVIWNAMIGAYSQQGMGQEAFRLYSAMQDEGIAGPDSMTFVYLLQACASVGALALEMGKQLHRQIIKQELEADVFVASSVVNMYAKCGSLEDAQRVFEVLGNKDVVTWNAMIAGYSHLGMGQEALHLYSTMQQEGTAVPDPVTSVCLLQACAGVGTPALEIGKQLHTQIRERRHQDDVVVASSLVNMYAKCGSLQDARKVFDSLGQKNEVTWTAMIAAYSQQGMGQEALHLYRAMQDEGMTIPDSVTFVCILQACANVAALHLGRQLHAQIVQQGLQTDEFVASSLINMYGKSGSMLDAQQVFDTLPKKDVVTWNALIAGYTCQGDSEGVFNAFQKMRGGGILPDGITLLCVLTVCSHVGLGNKGWEYFEAMSSRYGIIPMEDHYTCMVDALCRAGQLDAALAFVRTMPLQPKAAVWHTLLGACRKWRNVEVGRYAFEEAVKLNKKDAAAYVLMSNIYTSAQMWDQAQKTQAKRKRTRAWKQPGQSWWTDREGLVHAFSVGNE